MKAQFKFRNNPLYSRPKINAAANEEAFYHYTTEIYLDKILESKQLKTTSVGISEGERPALWLSTNPVMERTALKGNILTGWSLTMKQQHEVYGLARIQVKNLPCIISWAEFKRTSGSKTPSIFKCLEMVGNKQGAQHWEWFVSYEEICISDFIKVEIWDGKSWKLYMQNRDYIS